MLLPEGYPYYPNKPEFVQDVQKLQSNLREYVDPGTRADPEKKALFGAAKEVRQLSVHIGVRTNIRYLFNRFLTCLLLQTEIVGLQPADMDDKQKDELALLVA